MRNTTLTRIKKDQLGELNKIKVRSGMTITWMITRAIDAFLKKHSRQGKK